MKVLASFVPKQGGSGLRTAHYMFTSEGSA